MRSMNHWGLTLVTYLLAMPMLLRQAASSTGTGMGGWRPIKTRPDFYIGPKLSTRPRKPAFLDHCSLYKAVLNQRNFQQYVQYKHHAPDLKEFTLCMWHKFYNHSDDQPLFSYSLPHKSRAIYSWVANTPKKSFYMLAVNDHIIYRINYPMKLNKWYHMCQSWNGKNGEWQLWLNNERVARGFYNLMVGKVIKSGGIAISGQDKTDYGPYRHFMKTKTPGLQGEITLLNLYKAALTVGKAYTDHKYHHAHRFFHEGEGEEDDEENEVYPPIPPEEPTSEHPFLENGQLKPRLPINELLAKPKTTPNPFANLGLDVAVEPTMLHMPFDEYINIKRNDRSQRPRRYSVRENNSTRGKELNGQDKQPTSYSFVSKKFGGTADHRRSSNEAHQRQSRNENIKLLNKKAAERHDFGPEDGGLIPLFFDEMDSDFMFYRNKETPPKPEHGGENGSIGVKKQFEPAEWEVRKISEMCSGCGEDPFKKANVLSWQETPKKLFAGAKYVTAIPKCHIF